ncbi:hypothetical protein Dimus_032479 [Dionaea muscipula]
MEFTNEDQSNNEFISTNQNPYLETEASYLGRKIRIIVNGAARVTRKAAAWLRGRGSSDDEVLPVNLIGGGRSRWAEGDRGGRRTAERITGFGAAIRWPRRS